jgi:hypothetical protein
MLKTYEEANCTAENNCAFSFTDQVPNITGMVPEWDEVNLDWNLRVYAQNITGS